MSGQRTGIGRYSVIIIGLLAVLCDVATLGSFLAAAGEHLTVQAVSLGSASAGFFGVGFFYSCGRSNAAVVCATRNPLPPNG
jgi:hypothetical protein